MKHIEETRRIIAECFQLTLSLDTFGDDTMGLLHVELVSDDFSAKVLRDFSISNPTRIFLSSSFKLIPIRFYPVPHFCNKAKNS